MLDKIIKYFRLALELLRTGLKKIPFPASPRIIGVFSSWWHFFAIFLALILFLYYPLGSILVDNIDDGTEIEVNQANPEQSSTVEMMAFIINREISDKVWTPNLPFFFPSYFLDNMPNFQRGMFSSVSTLSKAMSVRLEPSIDDQKEKHLQVAAKLLQYPADIWMFSPSNRLMPVPSSHSQYRRARKQLIRYTASLNDGSEVFYRNPSDLSFFLKKLSLGLDKSIEGLETQIREYSSSYIDNNADNIFYYTKGRIYADYLLVKALGTDYKNIIVDSDTYLDWTRLLNALEQGSQISPTVVRNGEISSISAPNHLSAMAFYTLKSRFLMQEIIRKLDHRSPLSPKG